MDPFHPVDEPAARAARRSQFGRFHDDTHPQLVAILHALHGDRVYANRATHRAFVQAWRHWPTVCALPDPAGWTRQKARQVRPPQRQPKADAETQESGWIAPVARPMFAALRQLPDVERTVVALHHVGGLAVEQVAEEEHLPLDVVMARLAAAYQVMAERLGWISPGQRTYRTPDPSQPIHIWAAVELTELAHALSYRSDRHALDRVFRGAARQRLTVTSAAAAVLTIGLAGTLALTHHPTMRYDLPLPPAGAPTEQGPAQPRQGSESTAAPLVPGTLSAPAPAGPPTDDVDDLMPAGSVTAVDDPAPERTSFDGGGNSTRSSGGHSSAGANRDGSDGGDSGGNGHHGGGGYGGGHDGGGHDGGGHNGGGYGGGHGGGGHDGGGHGGGHDGGGHDGGHDGGHGGGGHGGGGHGGGRGN